MGLALGIGISMHYQVINLLIFFATVLFVPNTKIKQKLIFLIAMTISFIIPTLPIIIWESQQNFANTRNILDYLLVAQYRIYVPNSWRLFLFNFLPTYWSFVIGVFKPIGFGLFVLSGLMISLKTLQKKIPSPLIPISVIFFVLIVLNRYYRGERSEGYLLYFQPFILLISAYSIHELISEKISSHIPPVISKISGYVLFSVIVCANLTYVYQHIKYISPVAQVRSAIADLKKEYPQTKFSVYDYKWENSSKSQPLSFLLHQEKLIDKNGVALGLNHQIYTESNYPIVTNITGLPVFNISKSESISNNEIWVNVNPDTMYDDLMKWGKKPQLKSNYKFPWEKQLR